MWNEHEWERENKNNAHATTIRNVGHSLFVVDDVQLSEDQKNKPQNISL